MTCSIGRSRRSAGSTSSRATVWPSTNSRPKPLRRRAASVSAIESTSPGSAGCGADASSRRPLAAASSSSAASRAASDSRRPATTGMSKPIRSRVPAGSVAERAGHDFGRLAHDFLAAGSADRPADPGVEQPQVVVNLGRRPDGRARVADAVLLPDRNRRADALDRVDVRLLHPLQELARVGRQRFDVAPLPFGIDRVEGQRRLARSR